MEPTEKIARTSAPADETATVGEVADMCERREAMYALLARLYRREVDGAFFDELRAMRFPAATGNEAADEGYRLIVGFLGGDREASLNALALDFASCFIGEGMSSFSAAYPYESVHTSEKRLLMQDARDEVLAVMRAEGVEKREDFHETEDHIATELEFMRVLAGRSARALRAGDTERAVGQLRVQRNFFKDHLASWVPLLTADMRKFAHTDFYRGVASLTDGFIQSEQEFLEDVIADGADENA